MATAGVESFMKISTMSHPVQLESLTFDERNKIIKKNMYPIKRLVIAERVKFNDMRQEADELATKMLFHLKKCVTIL